MSQIIYHKNLRYQSILIRFTVKLIHKCMIIMLLCPMSLHAATQCSEGSFSSGTIEINIVKDRAIVIKGLRDFNFGSWNLC